MFFRRKKYASVSPHTFTSVQMRQVSRRHFLRTGASVALGFSGLRSFASAEPLLRNARRHTVGYGPLVADPNGLFDLPAGFSYRILSRPGDSMSDGFLVPTVPDGMAAFPGENDLTILVRNHEVNAAAPGEAGPFGLNNDLLSNLDRSALYDAGADGSPCLGGTSTLIYDTQEQRVVSQHLSLIGTLRNCAGGPTPWNTWITCEETTIISGEVVARDHGYNFEVPATMEPRLAAPVPLKAMGRFNHEAVAVDPASGTVYETEDRSDGLIYRFLPNVHGHLSMGGRLQTLAIRGRPSVDTRNWEALTVAPGEEFYVEWIDLEDIDSPDDDLRYRGFEAGAALFARGEGMWYGNDAIYFACTNGGSTRTGQVWCYIPSPAEGTELESRQPGRLQLFIEPNDLTLLEHCDNVTVAPWGDLILCEDGSGEQFLVGVTPDGNLYKLGRNAVSESELAGATFSPDGSTLFFNIQNDGLTLAVTGPWK